MLNLRDLIYGTQEQEEIEEAEEVELDNLRFSIDTFLLYCCPMHYSLLSFVTEPMDLFMVPNLT